LTLARNFMAGQEKCLTIQSSSPDDTLALGQRLGRMARAGLILALSGDLGAGKTTLTQGIAQGLGIQDAITSPTFTFVNEYDLAPPGMQCIHANDARPPARLLHIDLYRLPEAPEAAWPEAETFGLDEILDDAAQPHTVGLLIIEWAERIAPHLPPDHLIVAIAHAPHDPDARNFTLCAGGPISMSILLALADELNNAK
jgi:tRNA threonylcarbamoyladenosine biosynthesis protein TsaE